MSQLNKLGHFEKQVSLWKNTGHNKKNQVTLKKNQAMTEGLTEYGFSEQIKKSDL